MSGVAKRAPSHLQPATAAWWRHVVTEFALEQHHERLLTLACEAWDQAVAAREELAKAGTYYKDRFEQPKAHPAVAVERDARIAFARLVRELDLETSDHSPDPDPATRLR